MSLTPTDITPGVIVTNGRGRFKLIGTVRTFGPAHVAHGTDAYVDAYGKMQRGGEGTTLVASIIRNATRLATPEERAEVVRCLNPKGIDHA